LSASIVVDHTDTTALGHRNAQEPEPCRRPQLEQPSHCRIIRLLLHDLNCLEDDQEEK
jgi:hypothetical protein